MTQTTMKKIMNAEELIKLIETKKTLWDEYSSFTIKGVGNLSVSDIDTIQMYAQAYIDSGATNFGPYIEPMGEIKEVLDACGIQPPNFSVF